MNEIDEKEHVNKKKELNKDELLDIINGLPFKSNITFTGGELFLKKGIDQILTQAAAIHNVTIASNGALLGKYAELVVESGIQSVSISLDGPVELHEKIRNQKDLYKRIEENLINLKNLKEKNSRNTPYINFNSVILKENYTALPEIIKLVKELDANSCSFQIFDPSLNRSGLSLSDSIDSNTISLNVAEKIDPLLLKESLLCLKKEGEEWQLETRFVPSLTIDEIVLYYQGKFNLRNWQCIIPWSTMRISPYGDVYPCLNFYIGNVKNHDLTTLWNNNRYVRFRRLLKERGIFGSCVGCCKMVPKS
jgi:MoaA/NifB/PqqE/SkfB family radical SAM enzyme